MSDHAPTPTGPDLPRPDPVPTASAATEPPGEPVGDRPAIPGYEILDALTPGGMGVVYRARQVALNRMVALKVIRAGAQAGPQERARFRVEAEAVASLSHPHVVAIYDYGECDGVPYLAMEFADGGSLAQRLAGEPLPPSEALELVETLARAVHHVHERGILHRDLKPANVLLTADGLPKLADFGLAKRLDRDQGLTRTRAVLGTASYMAPEQAAGDKHALGPAADVYALGAILYELLTGQPPFRAETRELTIHQVLSEEPPPPTHLRPDVPVELEAICLQCLEKDPGRRFASALALAEDLARHRRGEAISLPSAGGFAWHVRWGRRAGYEIEDVLGAGAAGIVYRARHLSLKRTVALQRIATRGRLDPARLAEFQADARAAADRQHPNLVEVYDFGECDGVPYVAREYVEGSSLADGGAGPSRPAEQTAALVETLARAVHHAHLGGVVHGGLKPSRVLLGADGTAKVIGFGLARTLGRASGSPYGYPGLSGYLAPEQAEDRAEPVGPAADVYALGAILYELLTGRPPVLADSVEATLEQLRHGRPEPPRHGRPDIPSDLEAICLKCLEQSPDRRYPSAAALAEDLRRFRGGEVLFIDDLDDWAQQKRWARRAGYDIVELLGQGPDGFSYKARHVATDRVVFLKRVAACDRFVPAAKARFRREAHLLARLRHPGFVRLVDQGEQNDLAYFAREFVDGPSLAQQVPDARLAAEWVESLARAVEAAHGHGLVHGGLSPDVVRLTPPGVPKITRFRRAWVPDTTAEEARPESETCRLAACLAPEQLEARRGMLGPAADVYALGAILYTLLTGRPPFRGPSLADTLEQVRSQAPVSPGQGRPAVPSELEGICLQCLEKQPGRRPVSAQALANELGRFLGR